MSQTAASPHFPAHTLETAPAAARPALERTSRKFGFLPLPLARFATSPLLVRAFDELLAVFEGATLSPVEREVVVMVIAGENGCDLCRTMHRGLLLRAGASPEVAAALFERRPAPGRAPPGARGVHRGDAARAGSGAGRRSRRLPPRGLHRRAGPGGDRRYRHLHAVDVREPDDPHAALR